MTVILNTDRRGVEIKWDTSLVQGDTVTIRCVNPDGGDISTRSSANDGRGTVTFPNDYSGDCDVTVLGSTSGEDTGTISV